MQNVKHYNLGAVYESPTGVAPKVGGPGLSKYQLLRLMQQAKAEAIEDATREVGGRQECHFCHKTYALSFIRQVEISWRKVEGVCGDCRHERGIKAADCVR